MRSQFHCAGIEEIRRCCVFAAQRLWSTWINGRMATPFGTGLGDVAPPRCTAKELATCQRGRRTTTMNLRFVEAFVWVVRLQSITRAAEKLFLTQSAVSSRIAALEEELGVQLILRNSRPLRLTEAGRMFYEQALQIINRLDQLKT
eukprot:gene43971-54640_t